MGDIAPFGSLIILAYKGSNVSFLSRYREGKCEVCQKGKGTLCSN